MISAPPLYDGLALAWFDPAAWRVLRAVYLGNLVLEGSRYLVCALVLWGALHVLLRRRLSHRQIAGWPSARDVRRELTYSISTLLIFASIGAGTVAMLMTGHAQIYRSADRYGWWWLVLSLPVMLLWHDLYFYWTHRLLHTPWLFRRVHGVHHRSRNPSPWAAYAFHPVEALVNGLVTPLALCVMPLHVGVLMAFSLHQILRNAHGHASVETMPAGFVGHWFWGRFTTTTHHHLHHETASGNFGLWFTWWDRLCATERADYRARFEATTRASGASDRDAGPGHGAALTHLA
jgi:sterol desaturase/sphingolipid hydroxylase (fatty acid hydroxylase superfamily)